MGAKNRSYGLFSAIMAIMALVFAGCGGSSNLISGGSAAQKNGDIQGYVYAPVGALRATTGEESALRAAAAAPSGYAALSGATVTCGGKNTTTNSSGYYLISGITVGSQTVTISKSGYQTLQISVTITQDATTTVTQDGSTVGAINPSESGSISVTSSPSGARIFIDGLDTTFTTPKTISNVKTGSHEVYVTLAGYVTPAAETVPVTTGGTADAAFTLSVGSSIAVTAAVSPTSGTTSSSFTLTCSVSGGSATTLEGRCNSADNWAAISSGNTKTCTYSSAGSYTPGCRVNGSASDNVDTAITVTAPGATVSQYYQSGGTATKSNQSYGASTTDASGVKVENSGTLNLSSSTVTTTGDTSNADSSSFYGLNAGVLATTGSTINLTDTTISTTGTGANGAFAYGSGSTVNLTNVTINCTGRLGHGVDATNSGKVNLTDVNITTGPGGNSAALATDRGGGTITVTRGRMSTTGADAPGIYSTGNITVTGATISASGSEAAVIEGTNSVVLTDTTLSAQSGSMSDKWGLLIYQSMSGDASGQNGAFTMTGGSLTYTGTSGPLFFVTNTAAKITLKGVSIPAVTSGVFLKASTYSRWSSTVGGTVTLIADGQTINGNFVIDGASSITITLKNGSTLTGAINTADTGNQVKLIMDSTSTWNLTGNSHLTSITNTGGAINSNGYSY